MTEKEKAIAFYFSHEKEADAAVEAYAERFFISESFEAELIFGQLPPFEIIFTTARGAFLWDSVTGSKKKFLAGKFYGATKSGNTWLFARSNNQGYRNHLENNRISDLCKVEFEGSIPLSCKSVIKGIPGEVHQIDIFRDTLVIPHTDYNQIMEFSLEALKGTSEPATIESARFLEFEAEPFSHINSVFITKEAYHLVAHNYSWKTKRESEYIRKDKVFGHSERFELHARSAHNFLPLDGNYFFCDSEMGNLRKGESVVFKTDTFLRGLSFDGEYFFVGGSDVRFDNYKRMSQNAHIYIIRPSGAKVAEIKLPEVGDIYEIRQFDKKDYSFSNSIDL